MDGRGGEHAPNIATNPATQQLSPEALVRIVEDGVPARGMPSFRTLGAANIQAVVDYLRVLQGKRSRVAVPGDPLHGKLLFFGTAGCSSCHMVQGKGGFLGPDLSAYSLHHSVHDIRQAIINPHRKTGMLGGTVVAVSRSGRKWVGIARNEDNFSLQLQTPDGRFHLLMKSDLASLRHDPRSLMPSDYGSRLTPRDLDDIISFLCERGSGTLSRAPGVPDGVFQSALRHRMPMIRHPATSQKAHRHET